MSSAISLFLTVTIVESKYSELHDCSTYSFNAYVHYIAVDRCIILIPVLKLSLISFGINI